MSRIYTSLTRKLKMLSVRFWPFSACRDRLKKAKADILAEKQSSFAVPIMLKKTFFSGMAKLWWAR